MQITVLQHDSLEGPGTISEWAEERSVKLHIVSPATVSLSSLSSPDALIILGGPMGTYEEEKYSWLAAEKKFIRDAIDAKKRILGICLGAQLLANCLGSKVYPHQRKEIGWFPVKKREEAQDFSFLDGFSSVFNAFHWHGDTFDLPKNATHIFENPVCQNQGFTFQDRVLALQFHLEPNREWIEGALRALEDQNEPLEFVQSKAAILAELEKAPLLRAPFFRLLDQFFLR